MWLDILYNFIILFVVFSTFFIFNDILRVRNDEKLNNWNFFIFILIISFLMITSYLYFGIFEFENKILIISISPLIIFTSYSFLDKRTIFILPIIFLITSITNLYFVNYSFVLISSLLIISTIVYIFFIYLIERFEKNNFKKVFFSFVVLLLINYFNILILYFKNFNNVNDFNYYLTIFLPFIFYLTTFSFFLVFLFIFQVIHTNISSLEKFSIKDNISFYKIALYKEKLINYIKDNNIEIGALVIFEITKEVQKNIDKEFILEFFRQEIEKKYDNAIFLRFYSKKYAFFIPLKKNEVDLNTIYGNNFRINRSKDVFTNISEVVESIEFNQKKINLGIALYGIHSYNIDELSFNANFVLNKNILKNDRYLSVYDYRLNFQTIKEKEIIERFLADEMYFSFFKTIEDSETYYIEYRNKFTKEIVNFNFFNNEEKKIIMRYLAIQSIKEFYSKRKNKKLIINYSTDFVNEEKVNIKRFIEKLNKYSNAEDILIGLEIKDDFEFKENFYDNLKEFNKNNIKIVFFVKNLEKKTLNLKNNINDIDIKYIINRKERKASWIENFEL